MSKNKFIVDGITVICNFILVFKGYIMTWFGMIVTRRDVAVMKRYFQTSYGKRTIRHEKIHVDQEKQLPLGWVTYYVVYLCYYFIMLFRYFNHDMAYRTVPFEIEAYENQDVLGYLNKPSNYKKYVLTLKERKAYYEKKYK